MENNQQHIQQWQAQQQWRGNNWQQQYQQENIANQQQYQPQSNWYQQQYNPQNQWYPPQHNGNVQQPKQVQNQQYNQQQPPSTPWTSYQQQYQQQAQEQWQQQYQQEVQQWVTDIGVWVLDKGSNILLDWWVWGVFVLVLIWVIMLCWWVSVKVWKHKATIEQDRIEGFSKTIMRIHSENREDKQQLKASYDKVWDALDQLADLIKFNNK